MLHRLLAASASVALLGLLISVPTVAAASSGASAAALGHSHRVCALPAGNLAACDSYVVDDAGTGVPLALTSYKYGYAPADLAQAYGPFGPEHMTIAIVDAYAHPSAASDLSVYRSQFGLGAANLTEVNQDGGSTLPAANVGWGQEQMLDLEMASAICPQCSLLYVGANSASLNDLAAAVTTAHRLGANVISNSYGSNENGSVVKSGAWDIRGAAVTVSSGDAGYGPQFPATSAGVIAVGGTSLTVDTATGQRQTETAWSGGGSGCSQYIAKPDWQLDSGCSMRTSVDVAAVADPYTGVAVYDSYGSTGGANWYVFGGTSVATPIVAALFAQGSSFGSREWVAQRLYARAAALFDVTQGSNGKCATKSKPELLYLCNAGGGYDGPTGNGTPNGDPTGLL